MPVYTLGLWGPNGLEWIQELEFPDHVRRGDTFAYGEWKWRVAAVTMSPVESTPVLRCIPA